MVVSDHLVDADAEGDGEVHGVRRPQPTRQAARGEQVTAREVDQVTASRGVPTATSPISAG